MPVRGKAEIELTQRAAPHQRTPHRCRRKAWPPIQNASPQAPIRMSGTRVPCVAYAGYPTANPIKSINTPQTQNSVDAIFTRCALELFIIFWR